MGFLVPGRNGYYQPMSKLDRDGASGRLAQTQGALQAVLRQAWLIRGAEAAPGSHTLNLGEELARKVAKFLLSFRTPFVR